MHTKLVKLRSLSQLHLPEVVGAGVVTLVAFVGTMVQKEKLKDSIKAEVKCATTDIVVVIQLLLKF